MRDIDAQLIHDMQNAAQVLSAAAATLHADRASLTEPVVADLTEMLTRRSDMLVRLLRDLSTSNLVERGELGLLLQRVAWKDICNDVLLARSPARGVCIELDVPDDAVVVADPVRVTQVLDNLVTNALRYGGQLVRVSAVRDGPAVRLTVEDDGPGVADDLENTLFEAYSHGASSHSMGGSGLGLTIVRQLCEAMGGTIEYERSTRTTFTVTLPALASPSVHMADDLADAGHAVVLWDQDRPAVATLVHYVANGLAAGHAVMVAAEPARLVHVEAELRDLGVDVGSVIASGQYSALDADALHHDLEQGHHIDRERFEALIAQPVAAASRRWLNLRVYGEIVDLYWRRRDDHLAIELEGYWNQLRSRHAFQLLCGYHRTSHQNPSAICDCHDLVLSA